MMEILAVGGLCTVQDLGRFGHLGMGVGTAGAMDGVALQAGNLMLGNAPGLAGLEVPVLPLTIRFLQDTEFALTGADAGARLDDARVLPWWCARARAGQLLSLGSPAGFRGGARSYITVSGGVDVPVVLGSRSTQLRGQFGGHQGRALAPGDTLPVGRPGGPHVHPVLPEAGFGMLAAALALPQEVFFDTEQAAARATAVRVVPAAEYDCFDGPSLQTFWGTDWKISAQSDRYGYRLSGQALALRKPMETRSHGIVPGVIQVPHSGQPIIQMRDAQPSGGYPKVGTVIEADLWRLGQAPAGSRVRFVPCSHAQAVAALQPIEDYLARVGHLSRLYRGYHG